MRATNPREQAAEILRRFDLAGAAAPFTRCLRCNGVLEPAAKEAVVDRLPERVRDRRDEFLACAACGHVYWKGTHRERMSELVRALVNR